MWVCTTDQCLLLSESYFPALVQRKFSNYSSSPCQVLDIALYSTWIDGGEMETVTDFIFLGSKITVDSDCSHEIKRWLLLGKKTMTNLDSILKSRHITLLTKVCIVKAMVFPVVMSCMDVRAGQRRLGTEESMFSNCGAGEDPWESLA